MLEDHHTMGSRIHALLGVVGPLAESPDKTEMLNSLKRIVERDLTLDQERKPAMGLPSKLEQLRLQDIEDSLGKELQLLKLIEDSLRLEDRPKSVLRLENEQQSARERIAVMTLSMKSIWPVKNAVYPSDAISVGRAMIAEEFVSIAETNDDDQSICDVASEALLILREVSSKVSEMHYQLTIDPRLQSICEPISSQLAVTDKLKFSVPLIPLLLQYESEIALGSQFSVSHIWSRIVECVRRKRHQRMSLNDSRKA